LRRDTEEVRERILRAAMRVFAEHGYFKAPASLIAKEAGVSKGLIFWYFRSKDELILEVASKSLPIDVLDSCLSRGLRGAELLRCVGEGYLDKYSDPEMRNLMLHTMAAGPLYPEIDERLRELCSAYVKKLAREAFGDDSPASRVRARSFFGSLMCYTLRPPRDIGRREYLENLLTILLARPGPGGGPGGRVEA